MEDFKALTEFLKMPLGSTDKVFERFSKISGASLRGDGLQSFLYIKGHRKNKVLLVAHADTCWDEYYNKPKGIEHDLIVSEGIIRSSNPDYGLGADDRAGCAILWLLKDSGHSLLITNGEERGRKGSNWLMNSPENNDIAEEINSGHQFAIQFDRRNGSDFKCYGVGTEEFRKYVKEKTGYSEPDRSSRTDIVILCRKIAGVNLSIGYYDEHKAGEYLKIEEWENTLELCRKWLSEKDLPRFNL